MVCPAGPVVYASRGPGGQGRPRTHSSAEQRQTNSQGPQITQSQYMLTCFLQTVCSYSSEQNSRISIWRFLKIYQGFSEKGLLLKKANNKTTSSICIIKALGGRAVTISKRIDLLLEKPWWLNHSDQLPQVQTISEPYQQPFPGAQSHLQPLPSPGTITRPHLKKQELSHMPSMLLG